ncbi:MAG: tripartite tricarboxylate transporter substrate binding protein [candidate division NC10 bacterium]|nr:tripartite tricarboxylate transporter substrate binding protein [candidate division NC10 bacterium]
MRIISAFIGCVAVLVGPVQFTSAQNYPNRAIRFIVPTAPTGTADVIGRVMAQRLSERLGQPVVVDNRPGASQMIGGDLVARSAADGYTMMIITTTFTTTVAIQPKLTFDPVNDLTGITKIGQGPLLLVVHPSLPVRTLKDLIALARAKPGELTFGSAGNGSLVHFATEELIARTKINMLHVPYKGGAPAVTDTVSGQIQVLVMTLGTIGTQYKAQRVRALAVTSAERSSFVPELPTVAEAGVPGYEAGIWWGLLVPAKTPADIVAKLNGEIQSSLTREDVKSRFIASGTEPVLGVTPKAFTDYIAREIMQWKRIAKGLKFH